MLKVRLPQQQDAQMELWIRLNRHSASGSKNDRMYDAYQQDGATLPVVIRNFIIGDVFGSNIVAKQNRSEL